MMKTQSKFQPKNPKKPFHPHPYIQNIVAKGKKAIIKGDQDRVVIITGREGSGKSTLALQIAFDFDPTFNLGDVVFNSEDFSKRIRECPKHKAIVFDEAFNGLSSKGALTKENKGLVRLLQECRQRNLFIIIVLPTLFLLEKYVAIFRSHYLINVKINRRNISNRFCEIYNYHNKKLLYIFGKTLMDYARPKIHKKYNCTKALPPSIDDEEYRTKKRGAFKESEGRQIAEDSKTLKRLGILARYLNKELNVTYKEMVAQFEPYNLQLEPDTLGEYARRYTKQTPI